LSQRTALGGDIKRDSRRAGAALSLWEKGGPKPAHTHTDEKSLTVDLGNAFAFWKLCCKAPSSAAWSDVSVPLSPQHRTASPHGKQRPPWLALCVWIAPPPTSPNRGSAQRYACIELDGFFSLSLHLFRIPLVSSPRQSFNTAEAFRFSREQPPWEEPSRHLVASRSPYSLVWDFPKSCRYCTLVGKQETTTNPLWKRPR